MTKEIFAFSVPDEKKVRLIINTDAKNEADDQFAIVHALLTQKFDIMGIVAAHFGQERSARSMEESFEEIHLVTELMKIDVPVLKGAPRAIQDPHTPLPSAGSDLIIREALSDDPRPLFCIFLGPLTDMASAVLERPEICDNDDMTIIWIGGDAWPAGGREFNLENDPHAARAVYSSDADLWQVPRNVYNMLKVSLSELEVRVRGKGDIGTYLFNQLEKFNRDWGNNPGWPLGESWVLGDSAALGLMLDEHEYCYHDVHAPDLTRDMTYIHNTINRKIRIYHTIDVRFILEDFYSKLELFSRRDSTMF